MRSAWGAASAQPSLRLHPLLAQRTAESPGTAASNGPMKWTPISSIATPGQANAGRAPVAEPASASPAPVNGITAPAPVKWATISSAAPVTAGTTVPSGTTAWATAGVIGVGSDTACNPPPAKKKKGKKNNPKFVGSCGIYLVAVDPQKGQISALVHRRSKSVFEANTIGSPGGIVERVHCGPAGTEFEMGARATAVKELHEETGVQLNEQQIEGLLVLPVGDGCFWGAECHRNFCAVVRKRPPVPGPEKASRHEIVAGGVDGIGEPAGDGYNAWVPLDDLLARPDLMPQGRVPLQAIADKKDELVAAIGSLGD